jgi:hypothetical protein
MFNVNSMKKRKRLMKSGKAEASGLGRWVGAVVLPSSFDTIDSRHTSLARWFRKIVQSIATNLLRDGHPGGPQ